MASSSMDSLYRQVAKKVLEETLQMKKGEAVTVETWNNGLGFARHVVGEARAMGCTAIMILEDEEAYVKGVRRAPKDSVGAMGRNEYSLLSGTDGYVFIPGPVISPYSRTLTQSERADSTRYNSSWYEAAEKAKLRGARLAFGHAGREMANMLGKSVGEIVRSQLKAALVDYGDLSMKSRELASRLSEGSEVTLNTGAASLRFVLKGELAVEDGIVDREDVASGNNMTYVPPGLITKELEPESVEGTVRISKSLTKYGVLDGAELEFRGGRLDGWKSRDRARLDRLLKPVPEEKRRLALLGIGANTALRYGLGQDRFVSGSVTLAGLGFNATIKDADLAVGGSTLIAKGVLKA